MNNLWINEYYQKTNKWMDESKQEWFKQQIHLMNK